MSKYRVIFLGPSSSGKTSTIKTLLRLANDQPHPATGDAIEVTPTLKSRHRVHTGVIMNREVTLVDTPGPSNPRDDSDIDGDLRAAFQATYPGPHVMVLVFSITTTHDVIRQTFKRYKERLGPSAMRFTLILFTGVDQLESNGGNFQSYIGNLPTYIKQLIGSHCVAFNNNANASLINLLEVREFMAKIDEICNKHYGVYYQVKQSAISTVVNATEAFEKNLQSLEHVESELNRSQTTHKSSDKSFSEAITVHHQNGDADSVISPINGQDLQNPPPPDAATNQHENLLLESVNNTRSETISKDDDEVSMVSQKKRKCRVFCCWPSNGETEFTQYK